MKKILSPRHARAEIYYGPDVDDWEIEDAWWYTPLRPSDGQGSVFLNIRGPNGNRCISIKLLSGPSRVGYTIEEKR